MAVLGKKVETPLDLIRRGIESLPAWLARQRDENLGPIAIELREFVDRSEGLSAEVLRRFEKSGAWGQDGALSMVSWLKSNGKLSGGAAMERVAMARQLEKLPETAQAFQRGDLGYQHVAIMTRTADKVGTGALKKEEASLLQAAQSMDPGQFASVAKAFEFRVDQAAALTETNRASSRRYMHLSEPKDGLVHLEGLLDAEGGAFVKTALDALMPPPHHDDERTAGQRRADALVDLARRPLAGGKLGSTAGQRPHLVITASVQTLAGVKATPPPQLAGIGPIAPETAQRQACEATVSWLLGQAELETETSHEHRTIPPATRRALVARDQDCVFRGCHRPSNWCDGHHVKWWTWGGETKLENLALVCGRHHRMLHEEGWTIERSGGRWVTKPPGQRVPAQSRSA
jgi:hypothetical protein